MEKKTLSKLCLLPEAKLYSTDPTCHMASAISRIYDYHTFAIPLCSHHLNKVINSDGIIIQLFTSLELVHRMRSELQVM